MAITDEEQEKGLPAGVAPVDADMGVVGGLIRRIAGNAKALASDQPISSRICRRRSS